MTCNNVIWGVASRATAEHGRAVSNKLGVGEGREVAVLELRRSASTRESAVASVACGGRRRQGAADPPAGCRRLVAPRHFGLYGDLLEQVQSWRKSMMPT